MAGLLRTRKYLGQQSGADEVAQALQMALEKLEAEKTEWRI